jgi:hypothetical protein
MGSAPARFTFVLQIPDDGPADLAEWRNDAELEAWTALMEKHR